LSHTTHPDLSTVVSLLAQHQSNPSQDHMESALYDVQYLSHTKTLGIYFSSLHRVKLETFLHFPIPPRLLSMSDANWGPQDASLSTPSMELPLFTPCSMFAFHVDLLGPLHWMSKRQTVTAGSSAEAKIYATNVSNFFWSSYKFWNFLKLDICLCLVLLQFSMTTIHVLIGLNIVQLTVSVTSK
jgi:hypothetical protein